MKLFKRIFKILLSVILAAAAIICVIAATKPDSFRIERSALISAPPDKIFSRLNSFHEWDRWSPWEKIDPAMKKTFSGPADGKGAAYAWSGNDDVGSGKMEIIASNSPDSLSIKLDFLKPFEAHNITGFYLVPKDGATRVTWVMQGPSPFISKVMTVFFSMDEMVGKDFEKGLAALKTLSEQN